MAEIGEIEKRIDRAVAGETALSTRVGGVTLDNMLQVLEFAKTMSTAKLLGSHLKQEPGNCLAVCVQAFEWGMSPFAVATKSYEVNGRLAYESQLIHAVIEMRAPLKRRLRATYTGDGESRRCTITGELEGEDDAFVYQSPPLGACKKKSPLWVEDPDQQLFYYASRAWARRYCPEVILGVYSRDEAAEIPLAEPAPGVAVLPPAPESSGLASRLRGQSGRRGFHKENVEALRVQEPSPPVVAEVQPEADAPPTPQEEPPPEEEMPPESSDEGADDAIATLRETIEGYIGALSDNEGAVDVAEIKKEGRRAIDEAEHVTPEQKDALRGQFTAAVLAAQKRLTSKKGKAK